MFDVIANKNSHACESANLIIGKTIRITARKR